MADNNKFIYGEVVFPITEVDIIPTKDIVGETSYYEVVGGSPPVVTVYNATMFGTNF